MPTSVTLAEAASALITSFEGCRLTAYQDTGGVWTIGHGHTGAVDGKPVGAGMTITQGQAEELLARDEHTLFAMVANKPILEAAALVSFGYNVGPGALERVLGGHALLTDFDHDRRGNKLAGLIARRTLEETLILISQESAAKP